jgi:hypothetical protein
LAVFAENQLKCLSMNNLRAQQGSADQAQSSPIKVNQGIFLNQHALQSITQNPCHF